MLESQLRGRTAVRSLEPSRVDIIPFWSTFLIIVASTKYMSPYLSTAIPAKIKPSAAVRLLAWRQALSCLQDGEIYSLPLFLPPFQPEHRSWNPPTTHSSAKVMAPSRFILQSFKESHRNPKHAKDPAECISLFLDSNSLIYHINPGKKLSHNFTQKFEALLSSSEEYNEDEEFLEIF